MRFTTKTEYGIICLVQMAKTPDVRMSIKELVKEENYPIPYLEKILRSLRLANIVTSFQGNQGGYTLAKSPHDITFKEIVDALEGDTFNVFCDSEVNEKVICNHSRQCEVAPVWRKTKEVIDSLYSTITLHMIANNQVDTRIDSAQWMTSFNQNSNMHLPSAKLAE